MIFSSLFLKENIKTIKKIILTKKEMEYEIMILCNTLGIAIIAMIAVYHLIGTKDDAKEYWYHYSSFILLCDLVNIYLIGIVYLTFVWFNNSFIDLSNEFADLSLNPSFPPHKNAASSKAFYNLCWSTYYI